MDLAARGGCLHLCCVAGLPVPQDPVKTFVDPKNYTWEGFPGGSLSR